MNDRTTGASDAVVAALAARKGVDEIDLTPRLYEVVDPDALDALDAARPDGSGYPTVRFRYDGYRVVVSGPDDVELEPDDEE